MFVIMMPVLMGFVTLGVEGARYLALKGRFRDASEVAALAISARGSNDLSENQKLAETVVRSMISDMDNLKVMVKRKDCLNSMDCGGSHDDRRFHQFEVSITSTHSRWFPDWTGDGMGFAEKTSLSMDATSRKHYGSEVDVVFVADFSDSMNSGWDGEKKITRLKSVVKDVVKTLEADSDTLQEKNTMGLVPFNNWTKEQREKDGKWKLCRFTQWKGNAEKTISALFDETEECDFSVAKGDSSKFYTVPLDSKAQTVATALNKMTADYGTASYEGIIRAAQLLNKGKNPIRLIIVLSDGRDSSGSRPYKANHANLNKLKYCDKIRTTLNSQRTESGRPVQSRIAVIGIDYDVNDDSNLADCAGYDNVFTAKNMDDVHRLLLELVGSSDEVGRLYNDAASK